MLERNGSHGSLLREWIETAPDAILLCDEQGRIAVVNSQAEELFGYERGELAGEPIETLVPERYRSRHPGYVLTYLNGREVRRMGSGRELFGRHKDGSEIAVDIALSPVTAAGGICVLAAIRDMTLWKQAEAQVQDYAKRLEKSNQNLKAFASVASHDLQAPLRQINTLCELLDEHGQERLDDEGRALVGSIADCADRLNSLVSSLLVHSRVDTKLPSFEAVDCSELLAGILADCETLIRESDAVVTHDRLPTVKADRVQLSQLLQNLIGNAIKYRGDRPPAVHIGAEHGDGQWLFSVRDNGIGIEPQHFDQIFAMFARLHSDARYPGTGLGLATCKRIVEHHGGKIWIESQPGEGSVFYFTIPAQ